MEFFCYHRDRPGSRALRMANGERHWSYMDGFAAQMIARGPTWNPEEDIPTGSVHILDLPSPDAARAFAFNEPNYQSGAYRDVMLRRWHNTLGRTMWDYPLASLNDDAYLLIALAASATPADELPPPSPSLIAYGPLLSDDATTWLGTAALLRSDSPTTASTFLTTPAYASIELHPWSPGGRPT
ncbi:hypothetical protein EDD29_2440 [Actinocorallia herbida]|uniref:YCII-related domain-containing protein n=1 Tax=Actinocorallia herbida TaxID=58109 RepID=A0A3N1CUC6_9ACTN|nr:YciI family protein [Actinocorallia herbida]ROO84909.1 hypothetical protein EDD29_2440 [Actinocorallia herbida]